MMCSISASKGYGILMAGSGVGALIAALTVASAGHVLPTRVMALGGVWIFSVTLALFAFNRNFYVAIPLLALGGFGMVLYFSTSNTVLQALVWAGRRGRGSRWESTRIRCTRATACRPCKR